MKASVVTALLLLCSGTAIADKVTKSVDRDGVTNITIRGNASKPNVSKAAKATPRPDKEFQVYELEGGSAPAVQSMEQPVVIVVPAPPPIAPNPAAFNYGYGYPYGAFGYPVGWGYPPLPPRHLSPGRHPFHRPVNYQNPPVNYQNPPVNYQNPPVNYQNPPVRY